MGHLFSLSILSLSSFSLIPLFLFLLFLVSLPSRSSLPLLPLSFFSLSSLFSFYLPSLSLLPSLFTLFSLHFPLSFSLWNERRLQYISPSIPLFFSLPLPKSQSGCIKELNTQGISDGHARLPVLTVAPEIIWNIELIDSNFSTICHIWIMIFNTLRPMMFLASFHIPSSTSPYDAFLASHAIVSH